MNKKTRVLTALILIVFIGIFIIEKLDKRPFKFEDFKSEESLKAFLEEKYPVGFDGNIAYKDMELAGAICHLVIDRSKLPNAYELKDYAYIGWCKYSTGWLSWPPKEHYHIIILGDKNRSIRKFSVAKYSGLII